MRLLGIFGVRRRPVPLSEAEIARRAAQYLARRRKPVASQRDVVKAKARQLRDELRLPPADALS
jgi:hypothetical protein